MTILKTAENGDFEVLKTDTDYHLGGDDFDQLVLNKWIKIFKEMTKNHDLHNPKDEEELGAR